MREAGPITDSKLLQRSLDIIKLLDPEAEIIMVEFRPMGRSYPGRR